MARIDFLYREVHSLLDEVEKKRGVKSEEHSEKTKKVAHDIKGEHTLHNGETVAVRPSVALSGKIENVGDTRGMEILHSKLADSFEDPSHKNPIVVAIAFTVEMVKKSGAGETSTGETSCI